MKKQIIYLLLFSLLFNSCREIIPIDVTKDQKLVLNGVLQKNKVEALISTSLGINQTGEDVNYINNAELKLYEGTQLIGNVPFDKTLNIDGYYLLSGLNLKYNTDYTLVVKSADYDSLVATSYIPEEPQLGDIVVSSQTLSDYDYSYETYLFGIEVIDDINHDNYYGISDTATFTLTDYNWETNQDTTYIATNYIYMESQDPATELESNIVLFNDELFNGKKYPFKVNMDKSQFNSNDTVFMDFYVFGISKAYYLFKKTLDMQSNVDEFSMLLGATPVQVYSNVQGGFGFFGAYSVAQKSVKFVSDYNYRYEK